MIDRAASLELISASPTTRYYHMEGECTIKNQVPVVVVVVAVEKVVVVNPFSACRASPQQTAVLAPENVSFPPYYIKGVKLRGFLFHFGQQKRQHTRRSMLHTYMHAVDTIAESASVNHDMFTCIHTYLHQVFLLFCGRRSRLGLFSSLRKPRAMAI